ncbi:MAG: DNA polymerase III subunit gamma/tau [Myxococcaceae bacterium]
MTVPRVAAPAPAPDPDPTPAPDDEDDPAGPSATPGPALSQLDRWRAAVEAVKTSHPRHGKSLGFGRLVALRPGEAVLAFPKDAAFHRATVTGSGRANVEGVLSAHFGRPTRLVDEPSEAACAAAAVSFAEEESRQKLDREKGIEAKVRAHPAVRAAMRILGGELEQVQVLERQAAADADPPDEGA